MEQAKAVPVKKNILQTLLTERNVDKLSATESNKLTKECLQKALLVLMSEKPFAKISITELVFRSGVSRQSFYRNYKTKESVLHDVAKNFFITLKSLLIDKKDKPQVEFYAAIFNYLMQFKKEMSFIAKAQISPLEEEIIITELKDCYSILNKKQFYAIYSFLGGFITVVRQWIFHGMTETPLEMAQLSAQIFGSQYKMVLDTASL